MIDIFKELDTICDEFSYGYVDVNKEVHTTIDIEFDEKYVLRTNLEIIDNKVGCCFDHVEAVRYLYDSNNVENPKSYFILNENGDKYPHGHTIILAQIDNYYYWYSPDYDDVYGKLRKYESINLALKELKALFVKTIEGSYTDANIIIYEYSKPLDNINCEQFYIHCRNGKLINIEW